MYHLSYVWRWMKYIPRKHRYTPTRQHGVIIQNTHIMYLHRRKRLICILRGAHSAMFIIEILSQHLAAGCTYYGSFGPSNNNLQILKFRHKNIEIFTWSQSNITQQTSQTSTRWINWTVRPIEVLVQKEILALRTFVSCCYVFCKSTLKLWFFLCAGLQFKSRPVHEQSWIDLLIKALR